jgi:hypothetical protein
MNLNDLTVTAAQYAQDNDGNNINVIATIDGVEMYVCIDTANRHYQAILDWVAEGNTIQDAD